MDDFAIAPERKRRVLIEEAAAQRDVRSIIVEKDFWVCWVLHQITQEPHLAPHLMFKGGTSLSKAYNLIDRFSEDIDLTIRRDALGNGNIPNPLDAGISNNERDRRIRRPMTPPCWER